MNLTELSKTISHALRHEPWIYELGIDAQGWVSIDELLNAWGSIIMYTRLIFGQELKAKLLQKESVENIGIWSHSIYLKYIEDIEDDGLDDILLTLNTMELGPEFAFSYIMLNKLADDLISGKEIDASLNEYRQTNI